MARHGFASRTRFEFNAPPCVGVSPQSRGACVPCRVGSARMGWGRPLGAGASKAYASPLAPLACDPLPGDSPRARSLEPGREMTRGMRLGSECQVGCGGLEGDVRALVGRVEHALPKLFDGPVGWHGNTILQTANERVPLAVSRAVVSIDGEGRGRGSRGPRPGFPDQRPRAPPRTTPLQLCASAP